MDEVVAGARVGVEDVDATPDIALLEAARVDDDAEGDGAAEPVAVRGDGGGSIKECDLVGEDRAPADVGFLVLPLPLTLVLAPGDAAGEDPDPTPLTVDAEAVDGSKTSFGDDLIAEMLLLLLLLLLRALGELAKPIEGWPERGDTGTANSERVVEVRWC